MYVWEEMREENPKASTGSHQHFRISIIFQLGQYVLLWQSWSRKCNQLETHQVNTFTSICVDFLIKCMFHCKQELQSPPTSGCNHLKKKNRFLHRVQFIVFLQLEHIHIGEILLMDFGLNHVYKWTLTQCD